MAVEFDCSPRKVEYCWAFYEKLRKQFTEEKLQHDAELDAAYEMRAELAVEWLKENEGEREFTDEEIEEAAQFLDEELAASGAMWAEAYEASAEDLDDDSRKFSPT